MKKIIATILLIILMTQSPVFSLDRDQLQKLMSKSKTSYAASYIEDYCAAETGFLQMMYGKSCKCAIKAGNANNKLAASEILDWCGL